MIGDDNYHKLTEPDRVHGPCMSARLRRSRHDPDVRTGNLSPYYTHVGYDIVRLDSIHCSPKSCPQIFRTRIDGVQEACSCPPICIIIRYPNAIASSSRPMGSDPREVVIMELISSRVGSLYVCVASKTAIASAFNITTLSGRWRSALRRTQPTHIFGRKAAVRSVCALIFDMGA
ncbi:hypothetical protein BU23DRAFT_36947 [Bimuria novae-zelandiae CBS 107.79]|uniref:Uncharacterized protein n=1 Tax=Bimuria novae-zelandiae CBS 107.79 TaxID=1447943 RepID=A0A6A5UVE1_9PLEO|nr:hypothetical protein BU23DRAFT_36947 [Bimuria novae-zelandiae CBS 107.79]